MILNEYCFLSATDDGLQNGPGQHRNTQGNEALMLKLEKCGKFTFFINIAHNINLII